MATKRIVPIAAIFIVLMAFTITPALASLPSAQNVQRTLQTITTTNSTTNSTTNGTPTPNDPTVSPVAWNPAKPTPVPLIIATSQSKHSGEVAASSTEKPQSSPSPTNATQPADGVMTLSPDPKNCSAPLCQPTNLLDASQKCLVYSPCLLVPAVSSNAFGGASAISAEASALSQNGSVANMSLPGAQTGTTASLPAQSVFEFSLLGLGAPTLLVGVLYLLLRRV